MIHLLDHYFLGHKNTIASYLIESSEGPILIESGPYSTLKNLEKAIQNQGFKLDDIKHVFITHIHLDHAGAAWYFAEKGATIYMHPVGAPHLITPQKLIESATKIYGDKMDYLWGKLEPMNPERVVRVVDEQVFRIGDVNLIGHFTPGHAIHHIAWQLEDVLFTGDVGGIGINHGPAVPPCPPPDIHIEDWLRSIQKIKAINPKKLYLTHFGAIDQVDKHLNELERRLIHWADAVKGFWLSGMDMEAMVNAFRNLSLDELQKAGVAGDDLKRYEGANPPDMSVMGFIRYWTKVKGLQRL